MMTSSLLGLCTDNITIAISQNFGSFVTNLPGIEVPFGWKCNWTIETWDWTNLSLCLVDQIVPGSTIEIREQWEFSPISYLFTEFNTPGCISPIYGRSLHVSFLRGYVPSSNQTIGNFRFWSQGGKFITLIFRNATMGYVASQS